MIGMQWETQNLSEITQATDSGPVSGINADASFGRYEEMMK